MADQLDLLSAMYRSTDPDTSRAAAMRTNTSRGRRIVLLTLLRYGAMTDFEIAARTGEDKGSMSKRRGELTTAKFGSCVMRCGTGVSPTGSPAAVWCLTEAGVREAEQIARTAA